MVSMRPLKVPPVKLSRREPASSSWLSDTHYATLAQSKHTLSLSLCVLCSEISHTQIVSTWCQHHTPLHTCVFVCVQCNIILLRSVLQQNPLLVCLLCIQYCRLNFSSSAPFTLLLSCPLHLSASFNSLWSLSFLSVVSYHSLLSLKHSPAGKEGTVPIVPTPLSLSPSFYPSLPPSLSVYIFFFKE